MSTDEFAPMTLEELAAEGVIAVPDKEVISVLDLAADIDLAIDGAAPIDLAIALNANVVAQIDAAVSANLLSNGSSSQALADQGVVINQNVAADAIATGLQDSTIDQSDTVTDGTGTTSPDSGDAQPMLMAATDAVDATADHAAAAAGARGRRGGRGYHGRNPRHARREHGERGRPRRQHRRHTQRGHWDWSWTRPATSWAASPAWSMARR